VHWLDPTSVEKGRSVKARMRAGERWETAVLPGPEWLGAHWLEAGNGEASGS
jgi:hypothetical protein